MSANGQAASSQGLILIKENKLVLIS